MPGSYRGRVTLQMIGCPAVAIASIHMSLTPVDAGRRVRVVVSVMALTVAFLGSACGTERSETDTADAWRVLDEDGNELGCRDLLHDHASEQPFTRQTTVEIPGDVDEITVEGRDQVNGYGGDTVTVTVPRDEG